MDDRNAYLNAMEDVKVKEAARDVETDSVKKAQASADVTKAKLAAATAS